MSREIRIVEDVPAAFAVLVAEELRGFAAARGAAPPAGGPDDADAGGPRPQPYRLAISGGATARRCYERLATVEGLPWASVEVYWSDERCVPPDDPDSNARLGHEALLDHVGPLAAVHPMSCAVGPDAYEAVLRRGGPLDLVHLGLGPDGHTASLFPGSAALEEPAGRLVSLNRDPAGRNPHDRITLTLPALDAARLAVFTVSGTEKHEAYLAVRAGGDVPACRVASERVVFLVDPAAAGG